MTPDFRITSNGILTVSGNADCHQYKCPACGKFLEKDPDAYYDLVDPAIGDLSHVVPFCNEQCAVKYRHAALTKK